MVRRPWKIRSQIAALQAAASLVLLAGMAHWIHGDLRHQRQAIEGVYARMAATVAHHAAGVVRDAQGVLSALAGKEEILASLERRRCAGDLVAPLVLTPRYADVLISDLDGSVVCSGRAPAADAPSRAPLSLLSRMGRENKAVIGLPQQEAGTGRSLVPMAHPLRTGAGVAGAVLLWIDLEYLTPEVSDVVLPGNTVAGILSVDGIIAAPAQHPGTRASPFDSEAGRRILELRDGTTTGRGAEGVERLYGVAPVAGTDWVAAVSVPLEEVDIATWSLAGGNGAPMLAAMLVSLLLTGWLGGRITRSLEGAARAVQAAARGSADARVPETGPQEIAQIASEFNRLLAMLTHRERMEDALSESERNFSLLFEASPDAMLFSTGAPDYTVLTVNEAFVSLSGHRRPQIAGRPLSALDLLLDCGIREQLLNRLGRGEPVYDVEVEFHTGRGRIPVALSAKTLTRRGMPFIVFAARDITERRRAMQELQASQLRWEFAIEGHGDGLWDWDIQRGRIFLSPRCKEILGFEDLPAGRMIETWIATVHEDDRQTVEQLMRESWRSPGTHFSAEYRICHPDGRLGWVAARGIVMARDEDDNPLRMLGTVRDITEVRRQQDGESRRQEEFIHVGRIAMLGELTATLGHELNQPLTAIAAFAATGQRRLGAGSTDLQTVREVLADINAEARRAGEIIWRIRDFVRKRPTLRTPVDLNQLVRNAVKLVDIEARLREMSIETDLESGLPPVMADRIQIEQVLINLVKNALDAMVGSDGERRVVILTRHGSEEAIEVAVRDRGPGLKDHMLEEVFEPFFTTKPDGTGMGLPLSRTIIQNHGGRLAARSMKEGGAEFAFTLPIQEREHEG